MSEKQKCKISWNYLSSRMETKALIVSYESLEIPVSSCHVPIGWGGQNPKTQPSLKTLKD